MTFVTYPPTSTSEAIAVLKQDVQLLHDIVHGNEFTEVLTENGIVPSIDKVLSDIIGRIGAGTPADITLRSDLAALNSVVNIAGMQAKDVIARITDFQLDNYVALRNYTGNGNIVYLKGRNTPNDNLGGIWVKEAVPSADNDATRLVDANGYSWYLQHNGTVSIKQAGFVSDFVLTSDSGATSTGSGTDNTSKLQALFNDTRVLKIVGDTGSYWFGSIGVDQFRTTCSRPIEIDWAGAKLFCAHVNPNLASLKSTLIAFVNTDLVHMCRYEFTQINWNALLAAGDGGRGVHPCLFNQTSLGGVKERGIKLGNFVVHKGQSLVAIASDTKGVDRLEGVELYGSIVGNSVYYGLSLFYSGFNLKGTIKLKEYIRAWIMYDVVDVDINVIQEGSLSQPTSSSGLIVAAGDSAFVCERIKIKATFDHINGPIRLAAPDTVGALAIIRDCELDITVEDVGSNIDKTIGFIVALGAYDGDGNFLTTGTMTATDNKIKIRLGAELGNLGTPFFAQTRTPNSLRNEIDAKRFDVSSFQDELTYYRSPFGSCFGHRGSLFSKPIAFSIKKALGEVLGPDPFFVAVDVVLVDAATTGSHWVQRWILYGFISSLGTEVLQSATKVYEAGSGTYKPTLSFTTDPTGSPYITITAPELESSADGRMTMLFSPVAPSVALL